MKNFRTIVMSVGAISLLGALMGCSGGATTNSDVNDATSALKADAAAHPNITNGGPKGGTFPGSAGGASVTDPFHKGGK